MTDRSASGPDTEMENEVGTWLNATDLELNGSDEGLKKLLEAFPATPQTRRRFLGRWLDRGGGARRGSADRDHPPSTNRRQRLMFSATSATAALAILAVALNVADTEPDRPNQGGPTHVVAVDGSGDFTTIQAAVDAAEPGATIRIAPGTYEEAVRVTTDLTIVGGGDQPADVVVRIPADHPTETLDDVGRRLRAAFWFEDVSAEISNLTITGPGSNVSALAVNGGDLTAHDIVEDLDAYRGYPYGFLYVGGDASGEIFDNVSKAFVWLDGTSSMTVRDNVIHNVIRSDGESTPRIQGNDIGGVWVRSEAQPTVEDNRIDFANNGGADGGFSSCGVDLDQAARPIIAGNDISNASIGVCAYASTAADIRDNSFDGNGIAIALAAAESSVTGNDIRGDGAGLTLSGVAAPIISGNDIEVAGMAIVVRGGSPVIEGNAVCGGEGNIEVIEAATPSIGDNETC
jgi:parallel beta-helix repeat protein